MKTVIVILMALVVVGFGAMLASARILNVPEDFQTIQAGIDHTGARDTVLIAPGVYRENLTMQRNPLTLASLYLTTGDTSYMDSTIIDGGGVGRVILIAHLGESLSRVVGLTISNGHSDSSGGGIFAYGSRLEFLYCKIVENTALEGAGVVYFGNSCRFEHVLFRRNRTTEFSGGGIYGYGFEIYGCQFIEDSADVGSAIYLNGSPTVIEHTLFQANIGRAIETGGVDLTLRDVDFIENFGGGIHIEHGRLNYDGGRLIGNYGHDLINEGAGIKAWSSSLALNGLLFQDNIQNGMGSTGGGLFVIMDDENETSIRNTDFIHNTARTGEGAYIEGGTCRLDSVRVSRQYLSVARYEGYAIHYQGGSIEVTNSSFFDNEDTGLNIYCPVEFQENGTARLDHVTFSGNAYPLVCSMPYLTVNGVTATGTNQSHPTFIFDDAVITNSIFERVWFNLPRRYYSIGLHRLNNEEGIARLSYCNIEGGRENVFNSFGDTTVYEWLEGNIEGVADLVVGDSGDYNLSPDSPCIDAGDPDAPLDPDSTRADMGAIPFDHRAIEHVSSDNFHPSIFNLQSAYPNPFNSSTTIRYDLPAAGTVSLRLFDVQGRLVETLVSGRREAGRYRVEWNGGEHPTGVYLCRLQAGAEVKTMKMMLMK